MASTNFSGTYPKIRISAYLFTAQFHNVGKKSKELIYYSINTRENYYYTLDTLGSVTPCICNRFATFGNSNFLMLLVRDVGLKNKPCSFLYS